MTAEFLVCFDLSGVGGARRRRRLRPSGGGKRRGGGRGGPVRKFQNTQGPLRKNVTRTVG